MVREEDLSFCFLFLKKSAGLRNREHERYIYVYV